MIFIYLNIFISEEPIGGAGPCSANHMQMGCNIECFVLSQVYSGVFRVDVSNTIDLQARGMICYYYYFFSFLHGAIKSILGIF